MQKFLIIQTAFIGDVVLATSLIEKLHYHFPKAEIDFLLRKGNESLLANHPFLNQVITGISKKINCTISGKPSGLSEDGNMTRSSMYSGLRLRV